VSRTLPRRVVLGDHVYEVDSDAVRGYRGGIYLVGTVRRLGDSAGPRYVTAQERRAVTDRRQRLRVLAALLEQDRPSEVGPPTARDLKRERYGVVRPPPKAGGAKT